MKVIDCGDNSCMFAPQPTTGMRTNGGCRCFQAAGFDRSTISSAIKMLPELLQLREENERLEGIIEKLTNEGPNV